MTNAFGVVLDNTSVRWAAAEGVSETVIAAVLLLHERSVEQIVAELSAVELEQVIKLVGRSPRIYPPGTLDTLKQRKALISPPPSDSVPSNISAKKQAWRPQHSADWPRRRHTRTPAGLGGSPSLIQGGNGDTGGKRSLLWVRSTETMSGCALNAAAAPVTAAAKPVTARQLTTPITTMLLAVRVNRCGQRAAQNH